MTRKRLYLAIAFVLAAVLFWPTESSYTQAKTGDPLVDGFLLVETGSVSGAVEQITGQRAHMSSDIQPHFPAKIAGPAVTVAFKKEEHKDGSKDFQSARDAIDNAPPGSVYVITFKGDKDVTGIGGLMGTAMKVQDLAGAIIDAGACDIPQLRKIQFPTFSRGAVPSTSINHYRFVGSNIEIMCAGVKVRPNDIVVADEDGVAVVPRDRAKEILDRAIENDQTEHAMYPFIEKFKSIKKAVAEYGRI